MSNSSTTQILFLAVAAAVIGFNVWKKKYNAGHSVRNSKLDLDYDPTVSNISSEEVKFGKTMAEYKTTVTFTDGFEYVTNKTKYDKGPVVASYKYYIDEELREEIIKDAIAAHDKAYAKQRERSGKWYSRFLK